MHDRMMQFIAMIGARVQKESASVQSLAGKASEWSVATQGLAGMLLPFLAFFTVYKLFQWTCRQSATRSSPTSTRTKEKPSVGAADAAAGQTPNANKNRDPGAWTPERFHYPQIYTCPHDLPNIKPIPYRPFRWGEYHVTMGIRSMPWSEWIELDSEFQFYQRVREFRLRTRGEDVVRVLPRRADDAATVPGGADAAKELVYELAEYLSRRYPSSFRVTRLPQSMLPVPSIGGVPLGWDGQMPIRTIEAVETGITYHLSELESLEGTDMGSDGKYYFQAGSICVAGFWRMKDKIGKTLDEIHLSGNVPQFKEKLQVSMERFFRRMAVDKPVIRNNYFIQVVKPSKEGRAEEEGRSNNMEEVASDVDPEELGWSESTNGPEDSLQHGHGHSASPASYLAPGTIRLRSERQTLRRLPRTGAIVFGIRTYLFKVEDLVKEKGVAGRLASAIRSWPDDVATYKGRKMYREVLLGYLDGRAEKEGIRTGPMEGMLPYPY
ncbi:hypothetical protein ID866_6826 [Astraeus odoratus]|nr:hypothetical protein ID866_6826 [Astraeus odoratus]